MVMLPSSCDWRILSIPLGPRVDFTRSAGRDKETVHSFGILFKKKESRERKEKKSQVVDIEEKERDFGEEWREQAVFEKWETQNVQKRLE